MIFIVCILHVPNAFGPVRRRRSDTDFSPPLGYQYRHGIIPRRRKLPTRPVIQIDVTIAISQLQTSPEKSFRSRPPYPSRFDTERHKLHVMRRPLPPAPDRFLPRRLLLLFTVLCPPTRVIIRYACALAAAPPLG